MTEPTPETLWRDLLEKDDRTSLEEMALITFDEFCYCIDALAEKRVALAVAKCFRATGLRDGETWSRDALWAAKEIRTRMVEVVDRPAPEADPREQRVAAAVQEERERCAGIADNAAEDYQAMYALEGFPEDLRRKGAAARIATLIRRKSADRPAPEGAAPDLARHRCSTPSQEDIGSVSGERWRKKPVVIEAIQWTGDNRDEVFAWLRPREGGKVYYVGEVAGTGPRLAIETLEGKTFADPGHWIIRGVKGELYPCAADIFAATYDPAEPALGEIAVMDGHALFAENARNVVNRELAAHSAATKPPDPIEKEGSDG